MTTPTPSKTADAGAGADATAPCADPSSTRADATAPCAGASSTRADAARAEASSTRADASAGARFDVGVGADDPAAHGLARRRLVAAGALAALPGWSSLAFAAPTPSSAYGGNRFVLVVLRGGMDGLGAAPAIGDPDFAAARGPLARFASAPLPLDATLALHPNLRALHAMYGAGELAVVQATGLAYRERSHFDAQQVLESGGTRPYELSTGWLGRALGTLDGGKGVALATAVPLVLRGRAVVDTWAPSTLADPSAELVARLGRMYASDAPLAVALERARLLHFEGLAAADVRPTSPQANGSGKTPTSMPADGSGGTPTAMPAFRSGGTPTSMPSAGSGGPSTAMTAPAALDGGLFAVLARRAAEFLAAPGGPQVAVLELGGFDTHANQANPNGALANALRQLDAGIAALRAGLQANGAWQRTVVVAASEFGRQVAVNGTLGTDHGSGGVAFVAGGAVRGGRVVGEWPGLARAQRFEGRDLRTTTDLRAVFKGVLGEHLRVSARAIENDAFPGSAEVRPLVLTRG